MPPLIPLLLLLGCAPPAAAPNILVVSIDTLRADRLGKLDAHSRSLTPNLDALASGAATFTAAYSAANETLYAHAALFTGQLPSRLGGGDPAHFSIAGQPTLASVLRGAGYRTEAVVAGGHLAPEFGLGVGFDRYASGRDFGSFQQTVPLAIARLDALGAGRQPWLLFVHGYDVHAPYVTWGPLFASETPGYSGALAGASLVPWTFETLLGGFRYPGFTPAAVDRSAPPGAPDSLAAWAAAHPEEALPLAPADVAFLRGQYDAAARQADFHVGVLLEALHARDPEDNTVVVVLSDHGEDLLEHGRVGHRHTLTDETLHVPLLVRAPGVAAERSDTLVSLLDVFPTLAALAGAPRAEGRSLFSPDPARRVMSESADGERSVRTAKGRHPEAAP